MSRLLVILNLSVALSLAVAADFGTPRARVEQAADALVAILTDETLRPDARRVALAALINDAFDLRSLSQSVLARQWHEAGLEERERFSDFLAYYIDATYRAGLKAGVAQSISYGAQRIRGERASVDTLLVVGAQETPVTVKLKHNEGEWYVYDVIIAGVSLVSNYRSTLATIMGNEGMAGLLFKVQRRMDRYQAAAAGGDAADAAMDNAATDAVDDAAPDASIKADEGVADDPASDG